MFHHRNVSHFGSIVLKYLASGTMNHPIEKKPRPTSITCTADKLVMPINNITNVNMKASTSMDMKSQNASANVITTANRSDIKDKTSVSTKSPPCRLEHEEKEKKRSLSLSNTISARNGSNLPSITREKDNNISLPELTIVVVVLVII